MRLAAVHRNRSRALFHRPRLSCPLSTTALTQPGCSRSAKEAGVTVLNEIGVDPGIDHLYAMKMIDQVHEEGGKVRGRSRGQGAGIGAPPARTHPRIAFEAHAAPVFCRLTSSGRGAAAWRTPRRPRSWPVASPTLWSTRYGVGL